MRGKTIGIGLAALALGVGPAAATAAPGLEGAACVRGDAATAAVKLYGAGTELVRTERIAGLRTALASEPYIAPGTRQRMVRTGSGWCDAAAGLNRAWGRVGDGRALAAAYARLAAAPYFDGVTIRSHRSAGGVHRITTHARTNGVVADWVIVTDATGVRTATWKATAFAVQPFTPEDEGLTALPGANERLTRGAGALLTAARGLPVHEGPPVADPPGPEVAYTTSDGFKIIFSLADASVHPDAGQDVGESHIDAARTMRDLVGENMEEFIGWGLRSEWARPVPSVGLTRLSPLAATRAEKTGYVYINDSTSLYCFACVFIADDFNIHILSDVGLVLSALGYTYPENREREALSDVLGHEIFHNFQNSYVKPASSGRGTAGYYSEGTARMQEALHSYAAISHQEGSLIYADDGNGCNGYHGSDPTPTFAAGPFTQSYSACNFWLAFYGEYGLKGLRALVSDGVPRGAGEVKDDPQGEVVRGVELATGRPMAEASAVWARAIITGKNLTFGPALGGPDIFDWAAYLERWSPEALAVGGAVEQELGPGGVTAVQITAATRPVVTADTSKPGVPTLAVIRDTAAQATISYPASGDYVYGPGPGEKVYVLAIRGASGGAQSVKLSLGPAGTPPPPATTTGTAKATAPGGAPSAAAAAPTATCAKPSGKTVTCRLAGFTGRTVRAKLVRGGRTVASGSARLRAGNAVLRLRGARRQGTGRATLVLTLVDGKTKKLVTQAVTIPRR